MVTLCLHVPILLLVVITARAAPKPDTYNPFDELSPVAEKQDLHYGARAKKGPFIAQNDIWKNFRDESQDNLTQIAPRIEVNEYDQPFTFHCPLGETFKSIGSKHDNYYEDRKWNIDCKPAGDYTMGPSTWSYYESDFDGDMNFECTEGSVITGMSSYHDNYYEDRRYKFSCSYLNNWKRDSCYWTSYTGYDSSWVELTPTGMFLVGMKSEHDNYYEDRKFRMLYC